MKKFTFFAFISFLFLSLVPSLTISAQYRFPEGSILTKTNTQTTSGERCGTMKWLEEAYRMYPDYRAQYDANQRRMGEYIAQRQREQQSNPNARTTATIVIPVVFHVVMNAAGQNAITDAKVLAQLDTLNHDFGGTNGDSTNIPAAFQAVRGHSNIQFCLAQRTPNDLPTTGIVRVTSSTLSNGNPGGDPVKSTAQGGSDSWDPTKYLNIWLCNFTDPDLLGYATFPPGTAQGAGIPLAQQGVAVLAQTVPGGTAAPYNKGRTLTHEAGHYFWLIHINGDTNCGNDFPGTTSLDDTPQQAALTGGCPSGIIASGCASSPTPPGKMYQNFMDYTDDACMTMFTIGQGTRAESAINLYRPGLLTSNGCVPPPPAAGNDARISAIINPANASSTGCASVIPSVTITNTGSNTLTSATINVRLNGGAPISSAWTGSLAQGASANVTLASLPVILGSNTLKIHTTLPNGLTDANPANDTTTVTFTRIAQSTLPVLNTFETALAPPGWSINNPSGNPLQWFRFNPAGGSAGGSVWAAVCDNYNNPTQDQFSDIISPVISTTGLLANDSILVTFDLAHKFYPEVGVEDSLKVLVSTNCGNTWTTIWERGDPQLATAGSTDLLYNPPAAADWRNLKASIGNNIFGAGAIQVAIRNVNGFGNTMWLDNINVIMKPRKDMEALTINRPNVTECGSSFVPSLTVRNNGGETVTAFKTGYILDNGAPFIQSHNIILAAAGGTTTITFPSLTITPGNHTIRMFTAEPLTVSVGPDGTPANDTLSRTFTVPAVVANLVEGFEGSTFVPAGWFLINPNNDLTWEKLSPGRNSPFAAFIDNWSTNTATRLDHMQTPSINTNGAESLEITFDLAHKNYPGALDRLRVLVSNDCGATFTSVYSKSGTTLATAGSTEDDYRNPASSDWRTESVSVPAALLGAGTIVRFENRSDWGNNIFIDNINIAPKFKRDLEVRKVSPLVFCGTSVTPKATVFNRGTETVTGYSVSYTLDGGTAITTAVTTALAPGASAEITLGAGTTTAGAHTIKAYSHVPTTVSGTGDQYVANDTMVRTLTVVATVTGSEVVQSFEGATFPPAGWGIENPDGGMTWQRAGVGNGGSGSAFVRTFTYANVGEKDYLFSPQLSYTGVDSVKLTFDVSAALRLAVGPGVPQDTLTVFASKNCGNTLDTVYKKAGLDLHTLGFDPDYPQAFEFAPGSPFYWRNETIDLSTRAGGGPDGPMQVIFRVTSRFGNNVYVDNINLKAITLPSNLKENGYVVYPSPFRDQFSIWHLEQPTDLRYVAVYNAAGQLVYKKEFNGNADRQIHIDLTKHANGVYVVKMGYNNGPDNQVRIIKAN